MIDHINQDRINNLDKIPPQLFKKWGRDGLWNPIKGEYTDLLQVRSKQDAQEAFIEYTEYFNHVKDNWTPTDTSDSLVLLPCGSSKPIGSSTLHQKKIQAVREGGLDEEKTDIVVISEPCVVVPPEYRLSLPAVNYDFPPEYTDEHDCPDVFDVFVSRLSEWLESIIPEYEYIYPYLISGHQNKFDAAVDLLSEQIKQQTNIVTIPTASFNPDTGSYSGDMFKSQKDITRKVQAVLKYKSNQNMDSTSGLGTEYKQFYQDRFE